MEVVKLYSDLEGERTVLEPSSYQEIVEGTCMTEGGAAVVLPKIQIGIATKSAKAGIP